MWDLNLNWQPSSPQAKSLRTELLNEMSNKTESETSTPICQSTVEGWGIYIFHHHLFECDEIKLVAYNMIISTIKSLQYNNPLRISVLFVFCRVCSLALSHHFQASFSILCIFCHMASYLL